MTVYLQREDNFADFKCHGKTVEEKKQNLIKVLGLKFVESLEDFIE
jgi:hypothetical protein